VTSHGIGACFKVHRINGVRGWGHREVLRTV
jgi:hypothetical protein